VDNRRGKRLKKKNSFGSSWLERAHRVPPSEIFCSDRVPVLHFHLVGKVHGPGAVYYDKRGVMPFRWSAPESLTKFAFSRESDIWMFGKFKRKRGHRLFSLQIYYRSIFCVAKVSQMTKTERSSSFHRMKNFIIWGLFINSATSYMALFDPGFTPCHRRNAQKLKFQGILAYLTQRTCRNLPSPPCNRARRKL